MIDTCEQTGKIRYPSQAKASKARAHFRTHSLKRGRGGHTKKPVLTAKRSGNEIQVFKCKFCQGWHLGRKMLGTGKGGQSA